MHFKCDTLERFYEEWTKYEAIYKLNMTPQKIKTYKVQDYMLTSASENNEETFEIYIQNEIGFSKVKY